MQIKHRFNVFYLLLFFSFRNFIQYKNKFMEKVIKRGVTVKKVLVWNKTENEAGNEVSECELTFSDGSKIMYECDDVSELKEENVGIYELLENGTYIQVEDWE